MEQNLLSIIHAPTNEEETGEECVQRIILIYEGGGLGN